MDISVRKEEARIPAVFDVTVDNSTTTGVLSDVSEGVYRRQGYLNNFDNSTFELRWFAHRVVRYLYVLEFVVNVASGLESVTVDFNTSLSSSADFHFITDTTTYPNISVKCGNTTIPETPTGETHTVCMATKPLPPSLVITSAQSGQVLTYITAFRTSLDVATGVSIAASAVQEFNDGETLAAEGNLFSTHVNGWATLWSSGIEVEGRTDIAIAINASLYAILSSVRDDWAYGLAPGGLTNYYNGHSFWDTETWMYPPMLFLHPNISLGLMQYRYDRLEGARAKALTYSPPYNGTMFPWESAFSGVETCPTFAATGLREVHISGDISFAVWQEYMMRENEEWLRETGYPILIGVADFWISRSTNTTDEVTGECYAHIDGVIPPDEYVDHANDSVYTNWVAIKALNYAVEASVLLDIDCPLCPTYTKLADDLVILWNETLGIHPEYYNYSGQVVKQADVVLLHYPLGMNMTHEAQLNDCEYYAERTDINGPAMTWGMFAINYLDLLNFTSAARYFNASFQDNLHAPLQVWTETPGGNAVNFITGAIELSPLCPDGDLSLATAQQLEKGQPAVWTPATPVAGQKPTPYRLSKYSETPTDDNGSSSSDSLSDGAIAGIAVGSVADRLFVRFIGFGYLMTFLKWYGLGAVGFTMLIAAIGLQWYLFCDSFWHQMYNTENHPDWHRVPVNMYSLMEALFGVSAVLITFGDLIGKISSFQLVVMTFLELCCHACNYRVFLQGIMRISDIGGTYIDHMFGAYFGLSVAYVL
eukprot:gene28827-35758_t